MFCVPGRGVAAASRIGTPLVSRLGWSVTMSRAAAMSRLRFVSVDHDDVVHKAGDAVEAATQEARLVPDDECGRDQCGQSACLGPRER
jgi:hypothetical protein